MDYRRSNQWRKINPEYSLDGLTLKLKLQYFGHLMWRADSFEKNLMLAKIKAGEEDDREWDGWMASLTQRTWVWANSRRWWRTGKPGVLPSTGSQRVGQDLVTEQLTQYSLSGRHYAKMSTWIASWDRGCQLPPFYRWENWGTERLRNRTGAGVGAWSA